MELWREDAGTAAVCGRDLPPADALAADQRITAYARELRAAGLDGTMDQLRARAFLDFTLGVSSFPPPASGPGEDDQASPDRLPRTERGRSRTGRPRQRPGAPDGPRGGDSERPGRPASASGDGTGATGRPPGHRTPVTGPDAGPAARRLAPVQPAATDPAAPGTAGPAARINLTIPLATLLGLADRPGDAHGLGPIDPDLARTLAASAATNPRTTWCVTVTDQDGHPTAHGCARPPRSDAISETSGDGTRDGPDFGRDISRGPPGRGGSGRWRLRTPGPDGRDLIVDIEPLAVTDCDHRDESAGYQPSDRLRHLVEIRDGECTWPPCRRHARSCDFEHAVP